MSFIAGVLQISDLHFDNNLFNTGQRHWKRRLGVNSHDFGRLDALSGKLMEFDELGLSSDLLIVTGDVSTDGTREALETARQFIESADIYSEGVIATTGLGERFNKHLVVPGNHDRYNSWLPYQAESNSFEDVFRQPQKYPYSVAYRSPNLANDPSEPALIFFVFDSTAAASQELMKTEAPWRRIARGRIENDTCDWLLKEKRRLIKDGSIISFDGTPISVDYENVVRIAVLHHHPVEDLRTKKWKNHWTLLENSEKFQQVCYETGIDVVLFGHEHESCKNLVAPSATKSWQVPEKTHKIWFLCCASVSEFSEIRNGFYRIDFHTDFFLLEEYSWDGKSFVLQDASENRYDRKLGFNPKSDIARA